MTDKSKYAFPRQQDDYSYTGELGMTLREYYAGQALAGYCALSNFDMGEADAFDKAQWCVGAAEYLIAALEEE